MARFFSFSVISDLEISPGVILRGRKLGVLSPSVLSKYHHWSLFSNLSSPDLCAWVYRAQGSQPKSSVERLKTKTMDISSL